MRKTERSAQIWPLLAFCAGNRHVLTYEGVGRLIGVPQQGLGHLLQPIQSYCILKELPPLTSLVVSAVSGTPGSGFMAAEVVPSAQAEVFAHDWLGQPPPTVADFDEAIETLPSRGRSLAELRADLEARG